MAAKEKKPRRSSSVVYTEPELRDRLKAKILAAEKGGRAGQWSARKAQLLASEYEQAGGGYKKARRTKAQKSLKGWTEEKWTTADGKKAERGKVMARYLPEKAWENLTPAERKATDAKKRKGSRRGKQVVANTGAAKKARKAATKG